MIAGRDARPRAGPPERRRHALDRLLLLVELHRQRAVLEHAGEVARPRPRVKSPEICTSPGKFGSLNRGADCTTPSSTIATLFCGGCFGKDCCASWLNLLAARVLQREVDAVALPLLELRLGARGLPPGERGGAEEVPDGRLLLLLPPRQHHASRRPCRRPRPSFGIGLRGSGSRLASHERDRGRRRLVGRRCAARFGRELGQHRTEAQLGGRPTRRRALSRSFTPGRSMTMLSPSRVISASATPRASTRRFG